MTVPRFFYMERVPTIEELSALIGDSTGQYRCGIIQETTKEFLVVMDTGATKLTSAFDRTLAFKRNNQKQIEYHYRFAVFDAVGHGDHAKAFVRNIFMGSLEFDDKK